MAESVGFQQPVRGSGRNTSALDSIYTKNNPLLLDWKMTVCVVVVVACFSEAIN